MFKNNQLPIFILFCLATIGANAADLQRATTIELSNPSDVRDARTLNNTVAAMSNKVMECVKSKYVFEPNPQEISRKMYDWEVKLSKVDS